MAEGITDANEVTAESSTEVLPESTEGTSPVSAELTPEVESAGKEGGDNQPFHKNPRFQELVSEKNSYRDRAERAEREAAELRSQVASNLNKRAERDPYKETFDQLRADGVSEKEAQILARASAKAAEVAAERRVAPVEAATLQETIDRSMSEFAKEHSDFDALQPQMYELFRSLPVVDKNYISSSPNGLKWLYSHVKEQRLPQMLKDEFEKGRKAGLEGKKAKEAFAPTGGASVRAPGAGFSDEDITAMSPEEYDKNRPKILSQRGIR